MAEHHKVPPKDRHGLRLGFDLDVSTLLDGRKEVFIPGVNNQPGKSLWLKMMNGRMSLSLSSNGFQWDIAKDVRGKKREWKAVKYHFEIIHLLDDGVYELRINGVPDIRIKSNQIIFCVNQKLKEMGYEPS